LVALTVSARAQFVIDPSVGAKDFLEYATDTNWLNDTVNNLFFGPVNASTVSVPDAVFAADSNLIFTGTINATQFKVGDMISGAGIPDGTVITAINNAGVITISATTTAASSGALTVTGIGDYQRPSRPQANASFTAVAGSNELVANINAEHFYAVGEFFTANGAVPAGATITAISGSTVTINTSATASGIFAGYAVPGDPGNYGAWLVKTTGAYTVSGDQFVYKNSDYSYFTLGQNINWALAPTSGTFAFIVDMGAPGDQMQFNLGSSGWNGTINAQDNAVVFNIDPTGAALMNSGASGLDIMILGVSATNVGSLTKDGVGSLMVNTGNVRENIYMRVGGTVNINNGQIVVSTANLAWTAPRISGAKEYNLNGYGAVLELIGGTGSGNLIESDASINLHSGIFNAYGSAASASQQVGDVTLKGGRSIIGTGGANNTVFTLTMNKLLREGDATVNFLFGNAGSPVIVSDAAALAAQLVGGGGAAGSTNISILPWATGQIQNGVPTGYQSNNAWNNGYFAGTGLVTVSGGTLRLLTDAEYYATNTGAIMSAAATDNIAVRNNNTNNTVSANKTVNALRFTGDWDSNIVFQNNSALTVTSGVILLGSGASRYRIGYGGGGTLNTGANPLIVHGGAANYDNTIHVPYLNTVSGQNSPGLIVALVSDAHLVLDAVNDYNGYTLVQSGTLVAKKSNALNASAALLLDQNGALVVGHADNVSTGARVYVSELRGDGKVDFSASGFSTVSPNQLNIGDADPALSVNNTVTVGADGVIAPGGVATSDGVGTLLLGANVNTVHFLADSIFAIDIAGNGLADALEFINSAATLDFDAGATIALNFLNNYTPAEGDSWLFAVGYDTIASTFAANVLVTGLAAGDDYTWDFTNGDLRLILNTIPEPGVVTLLVTGVGLLLVLRRRR
jgi:hypothetical protein